MQTRVELDTKTIHMLLKHGKMHILLNLKSVYIWRQTETRCTVLFLSDGDSLALSNAR